MKNRIFFFKTIINIAFIFLISANTFVSAQETTDFYTLAQRGTAKEITAAFKKNPGLNSQVFGNDGETFLMMALKNNRKVDVIEAILKSNCSITATNKNGKTPLMYACQYTSDLKVVQAILDSSLSGKKKLVSAIDDYGLTPYDYAGANRIAGIEELLKEFGPDATAEKKDKSNKHKNEKSPIQKVSKGSASVTLSLTPQNESEETEKKTGTSDFLSAEPIEKKIDSDEKKNEPSKDSEIPDGISKKKELPEGTKADVVENSEILTEPANPDYSASPEKNYGNSESFEEIPKETAKPEPSGEDLKAAQKLKEQAEKAQKAKEKELIAEEKKLAKEAEKRAKEDEKLRKKQSFMEKKAAEDQKTKNQKISTTDFYALAKKGTAEQIEKAFQLRPILKNLTFGENKETFLMLALRYDRDIDVINVLLKAQCNINAKASDGRTPLMYAALYSSKPEVIDRIFNMKNLFDTNILDKINEKDASGRTALDYATYNQKTDDIVKLLNEYKILEEQKPEPKKKPSKTEKKESSDKEEKKKPASTTLTSQDEDFNDLSIAEQNAIRIQEAERMLAEEARREAEEKTRQEEERLAMEEAERIAEEEAERIAEEEARRIAEEEARRIAEEEAKKIAEQQKIKEQEEFLAKQMEQAKEEERLALEEKQKELEAQKIALEEERRRLEKERLDQQLAQELRERENAKKLEEQRLAQELKEKEEAKKLEEARLAKELEDSRNRKLSEEQKLKEELEILEQQRNLQKEKIAQELKELEEQKQALQDQYAKELEEVRLEKERQSQLMRDELSSLEEQKILREEQINQELLRAQEELENQQKEIAQKKKALESSSLYDFAQTDDLSEEDEEESPNYFSVEDPNQADKNGVTLIMKAAKAGNDWDIHNLIESGADLKKRDKDGWSVLMYAVRYQNNLDIVKTLIDNGASIRVRNNYNITPLLLAANYSQNPEILSLLLENRSPSEDEVFNAFILAITSENGTEHVREAKIKIFLNMNIAVNKMWKGKTPLMYACQYAKSTKIVNMLLENGARTSIVDSSGKTAFDYAKTNSKLKHDDIYWSLNK